VAVKNIQVKRMMKESQQGPLYKAALIAGMSEKTARKYRKLKVYTSERAQQKRTYSTRPNPFVEHWNEIVLMLEKSPELQAQTIFNYLIEQYPKHYKVGQLRSLQRHLKVWRAENGKNKLVIFRQNLVPGRQSQSDWTHMKELNITINGAKFPHLLFHFMLPYSGFETVMVCYTESFETLTKGFEEGVFELGGAALEHRTDNLTAATQSMGSSRVFTKRWVEFLNHYQVQPSRNNPGVSHENGSVEKSHDLFKNAVDQHLMLRQSRDFKTIEEYRHFLDKIKDKRNFYRREKITIELGCLQPLPEKKFNEVTVLRVRVTPLSTIQVLGVTYSVPSRLIGYPLKAMVYMEKIDLIYGQKTVLTLPRLEFGALINYRHIIDSLIRKPGAFNSYQYKESLYPNLTFRKAYDALKESGLASCDKKYLDILHMAKLYGEEDVTAAIELLSEKNQLPLKADIIEILKTKKIVEEVFVLEPKLADYNQLSTFRGLDQ